MSVCQRYERNEDDALEVLNTAFIKILQNLETYKKDLTLKPWVRRVTINVATDRYRQKKREREKFDPNGEALAQYNGAPAYAEGLDWVEEEHLLHLLHGLKKREKLVFNLFVIDGYTHKEISALLNITERSSIRHLTNARRKLQIKWAEYEPGMKKV